MLQLDASFMYASNLFCLKLIWFCLHRKGALGDDFLLEICWTVQFPNLHTRGNWKVLEDWCFLYISKFYFRSFSRQKPISQTVLRDILLQSLGNLCELGRCPPVYSVSLRWYFGLFLLLAFYMQRIWDLFLDVHVLVYLKKEK